MSPDTGILVTLLTSAATVGCMWGINKAQTTELKEALRHHLHSEHPKLDSRARDTEVELAVLKRQSQIDREERTRR
jgi:hypothetical protein